MENRGDSFNVAALGRRAKGSSHPKFTTRILGKGNARPGSPGHGVVLPITDPSLFGSTLSCKSSQTGGISGVRVCPYTPMAAPSFNTPCCGMRVLEKFQPSETVASFTEMEFENSPQWFKGPLKRRLECGSVLERWLNLSEDRGSIPAPPQTSFRAQSVRWTPILTPASHSPGNTRGKTSQLSLLRV